MVGLGHIGAEDGNFRRDSNSTLHCFSLQAHTVQCGAVLALLYRTVDIVRTYSIKTVEGEEKSFTVCSLDSPKSRPKRVCHISFLYQYCCVTYGMY